MALGLGFLSWETNHPLPAGNRLNPSDADRVNVPESKSISVNEAHEYVAEKKSFETYLKDSWKKDKLTAPSPRSLIEAQELFERWFKGTAAMSDLYQWTEIQFQPFGVPSFLHWPQSDFKKYNQFIDQEDWGDWEGVLVREAPGKETGQGFFALRRRESQLIETPILLMIPHRHYDMHTGEIGLELFKEGPFIGGAWNTFPRYEDTVENQSWQDLARREDSFLNAVAIAFMKTFKKGKIIQLHGFARNVRVTAEGQLADMIVSNGTSEPDAALRNFCDTLEQETMLQIRIYPEEVRELGATTNVTGKRLRQMNLPGFVHVEIAESIRERMKDSPELRASFIKSLKALFPNTP